MLNRKILFIIVFFIILALISCNLANVGSNSGSGSGSDSESNSGSDDNSDIPYTFTLFQQKMLEEVNYVRSDPTGYSETRLRSFFDAGTDNGAYNDIRIRSAVNVLELNGRLCTAASKYAQYLAENDATGHFANGTPEERCVAEGYNFYSGENWAAGTHAYLNAEVDPEDAAIQFVILWLIDDFDPIELGHRNNIMNSTHKKIGIGFYRHIPSTWDNYSVQDFGSK